MWHGMEGIGWGWLGVGLLHMILFWALLILVFAGFVKWFTGGSSDRGEPTEILKARYAKGELSGEEFERMKRDLAEQ